METKPARLVFFRPEKKASKKAKIIIGTTLPDEVVVKLKNGHKIEVEYTNFGQKEFIAGVYALSNKPLKIDVSPGIIYYIKCEVKSQGFKIMAQMEEMSEPDALRELKLLTDQCEETGSGNLMIM